MMPDSHTARGRGRVSPTLGAQEQSAAAAAAQAAASVSCLILKFQMNVCQSDLAIDKIQPGSECML
jgi:hypothetical protein